jgi:hypothetical protein
VFQKELYSGIPNVTVRRVLRKRLTQQHLEYHCKALFETPCIALFILTIRHCIFSETADCLENVGALTSYKHMGLCGLLQG